MDTCKSIVLDNEKVLQYNEYHSCATFQPFGSTYFILHLRLNIDNVNDSFAYTKLKTYTTCKCEQTENNPSTKCRWHFNKGKERIP